MKAIIMAGGEGTRLRPLTCNIPKPMVPVLNRPAMEHSVNLLKAHGVSQIGVTLQYMPHVIRQYFGDGSRFGVDMRYFVEDRPLGTAGSVKHAGDFLDDTFLVVSGDAVTDIDLSAAVAFHRGHGACATLVLKSVDVPLEYGVVVTNREGRVTRFLEKPNWSEVLSDTVNTGIYVLEPEVLRAVPEGEMFDFSRDLFPLLLEQGQPVYGYVSDGYWCDIGDLSAYMQCQRDILAGQTQINFGAVTTGDGMYTQGKVVIGREARIGRPVFFGKNVVIGKEAVIEPFTVIGDNCTIGTQARVAGAVLWDKVSVGDGAALRGCVLCDRVSAGAHARIMEGAVVGDGSMVGKDASVNPSIKVWSNKTLSDGSTLAVNLISGDRYGGEIFGPACVHGELNVDITPELACKLAAALGAVLAPDGKVGVSCRPGACGTMLKAAFVAGLQSAGAEAYDIGEVSLDMSRFAVRSLSLDGGVHIAAGRKTVRISLLGVNGADMVRGLQRRLEKGFLREEFVRSGADKVQPVARPAAITELYMKQVLDSVTVTRLNYHVVVSAPDVSTEEACSRIFAALGIKVDFVADGALLERVVRDGKADLGVIFRDGKQPTYIDENGTVMSEDTFFGIAALISMSAYKKSVLYVPPYASDLVNYVARNLGCSIVRVKEFMSTIAQYEDGVNALLYSLLYDNMRSALRVMEFMHYNSLSMSGLTGLLPQIFKKQQDIFCPNTRKGKVISELISRYENADLTEGVKVVYDNGWVLVMPDQIDDTCHIVTESYNEEFAAELCADFTRQIGELLQ